MKVVCQKMGSVNVIGPDGPLTEDIAEAFRGAVDGPLASPSPRVVVSMSAVPYIDSKGLELLLDYVKALRERNQTLKLAGLPATCREIIYLTDLSGEFELFDEVQDAVRSFL